MVAKVIGINRNIDFTASDGRQIVGSKVYVVYSDDHVEGRACDGLFVSSTIKTDHVKPGGLYDFEYESNFKGRARRVGISAVESTGPDDEVDIF